MRAFVLSIALILFAFSALAFEIEENVQFPAANPTAELRVISTADADLFAPFVTAFQALNPGIVAQDGLAIVGAGKLDAASVQLQAGQAAVGAVDHGPVRARRRAVGTRVAVGVVAAR